MTHIIEIAHPAVILGRLTERLYGLEQYAAFLGDDVLMIHASELIQITGELQTAIRIHDQVKQRLELTSQLVESIDKPRCEKAGQK